MNLKQHQIQPTDHIELWKYFSQRADDLKDRRWTIIAWMLGICIGLIAFILKVAGVVDHGKYVVLSTPWIIVLSVGLTLLLIYTFVIWFNYGKHIQRNQDRAIRMRDLIIPLRSIIDGNKISKSESTNLPEE